MIALLFWLSAATAAPPEMVPVPGSSFAVGKAPVTNAQYLEFIQETGHPAPERNSVGGSFQLWKNGEFAGEIASHPVVNVSWKDAVAYAEWLSKKTGKAYRLPTDEEWTRAAEGTLKGKPYPWGDSIDKTKAWFGAKWNGAQTLKPADFGTPNSIGLYGMAGNVWQWTADWYVPMFNGRPVQEELEMFRIIRGGSWANEPDFLKVGYRNFHPPDFKDFFVGFRVALSLAGQPQQATAK